MRLISARYTHRVDEHTVYEVAVSQYYDGSWYYLIYCQEVVIFKRGFFISLDEAKHAAEEICKGGIQ